MLRSIRHLKRYIILTSIAAVVLAFVISFVFAIVNTNEHNRYMRTFYSEQEKHKIASNALILENMFENWINDLGVLSNYISENKSIDEREYVDDITQIIPDWLVHSMIRRGYSDFSYGGREYISNAELNELFQTWRLEPQNVERLFKDSGKVYAAWHKQPAHNESNGNYFRLFVPVFLDGNLPSGYISCTFSIENLVSGNGMDQGSGLSHLMLADSSSRVLISFDERPTIINIKAPVDIREMINKTDSGGLRALQSMFFWQKFEMPAGITPLSGFVSPGSHYLLTEINSASSEFSVFSGSLFYTVKSAWQKTITPFIILSVFALIGVALLAVRRHNRIRSKYLAEYDQMSGTLNRFTGLNRLQKLLESAPANCDVSICFIDINGLKQVNDVLGHDSGDELIRIAAGSIHTSIRRDDFVIRMGGDEFLLVLPGVPAEQAELIWLRIKEHMEAMNLTQEHPFIVSASHGIAVIKAYDRENFEEYIVRADSVMYEEKRRIKPKLRVIRDA